MSDLQKYIRQRKLHDDEFAEGFDEGYQLFKLGAILRQAREYYGFTQEYLAQKLKTKKSAIVFQINQETKFLQETWFLKNL
jgi:ribosome-binding protein aMBF1 (putative translation factor)